MTAAIAVLFIIIIALAGLGLAVVNALGESAWGTFTIGSTIPLAIAMGLYMYRFRKGHIPEATVIGVVAAVAVAFGRPLAESASAVFLLSRQQLIVALAVYGFVASVLPVWMLLTPRDYLSTFMKIGTIALLVVGVIVVNPQLRCRPSPGSPPAGTDHPGPLFPFVFITIACGAISGSTASSGPARRPR